MGKGAIDTGGPRREFYRLLASHASRSNLFAGPDGKNLFSCNIIGVQVIY